MELKSLLTTVCLVMCAVTPALADDQGEDAEAMASFDKGTDAFAAGRFSEAADAFREAYTRKPAWRLLYNLGQAEAAAKRHGLALEALERYLVEGGDEIAADRQAEVRAEIERLRALVGFVKVIAPDGARIDVDGVARGTAPLSRELPVAAAVTHVVAATRDGDTIARQSVEVSGGRTATVDLEPAAPADRATTAPSVPPTEPGTEPPSGAGLKAGGWALVGIGGALLVAGGVTGGLALKAKGEVDDECPDGCYSDDYHLIDKRDNLALSTDVLLGVGGAVAAAGIVMLIVDGTGGEGDDDAVTLAPAPGGLILRGRF